jgi:predicted amidohydrolase
MLRFGYYQFRPQFGKIAQNTKKVVQRLKSVSADLIVLPELAFTGYYFRDRDELKSLAEDPHHSPTVSTLQALCKQRDFYLVTGFAEKHLDKYFNSALLIGPDGFIHSYRKLHLFNLEKKCFDPGDQPLQINELRGVKIGMMVCYDWIFPEVMRVLSLKKADIICHPSNLVLAFCQNAMVTRCIENKVYAITANRFGQDKRPQGTLYFTGKSQIISPDGSVIYQASSQKEELAIAEIDTNLARNKYITPENDIFKDRRTEFYSTLCDE